VQVDEANIPDNPDDGPLAAAAINRILDCGFWMLKRSIADRKMAALGAGRDKYLGIG